MIITEDDRIWVLEHHPGLNVTDTGISGTIEFRATYDNDADYFVVLPRGERADVSGVVLTCKFEIDIVDRERKSASELPALYVRGVPRISDRHCEFDGIACLCSPFDEDDYLRPAFRFRPFFEKLVIPYLYGQEFYNQFDCWPWSEYDHGVTGLLQSFVNVSLDETARCLQKFATTPDWTTLKALLGQTQIGGHTPCLCPKRDQFRRCHPDALQGLRRLHQAVREQGLVLP